MQTWKLQLLTVFLNILPCRGNMEGKIVGGHFGDIRDFPHAVCLNAFCVEDREAFWVCGSSILNQRLLLTAAHCVVDCKHYHRVTAMAGSSNLKKAKVTKLVVKTKIHEDFDEETLFHDIAICMLNGNLPLGPLMQRAIIRSSFPRASMATIAGWGVVNERQARTVKLKYVTQRLWSARSCDKWNSLMAGTFCASSGSARFSIGLTKAMFALLIYYVARIVPTVTVALKCTCTCESKATDVHIHNASMEGYIVGGNFTDINRFPHAVAMFLHPSLTFYCGASVLNQKILLTAAHCVPEKLLKKHIIYIMAGHADLEQTEILRTVRNHYTHANYDAIRVTNDISLLFLFEDLPLDEASHVKRVVITSEFPFELRLAEVCGWGVVNDSTKEKSLRLKYTSQSIIPLEECKQENDDWFPGVMCAGDPTSDINRPSKGDSGGALVVKRYHQIGLVSYRNPDRPGLVYYTNVSYFHSWIITQSMNNVCENNKAPIVNYHYTSENKTTTSPENTTLPENTT